MSKEPTNIIPTVTTIKKRRLIIGLIVIGVVLALTVVAIIISESGNNAIKSTEDGTPIVWCTESIPIYLDEDSKTDESGLQDIINVYQPYSPNLIYMGIVATGTKFPNSIHVHTSLLPSDATDEWGAEETEWNPDTGCVTRSDIYLCPDVTGHVRHMTACHEFGHSLGLLHSTDPWSAMHSPPGGMFCTIDDKTAKVLTDTYLK